MGIGDNELTSRVYTHHNVYDSTFPYSVLLQLLEENQEDSDIKDIQEQQLNIQRELGTFAG